jgi:hypothetical protein
MTARCACDNPGIIGCTCQLVDSDCFDISGVGESGSPYAASPILSSATGQLFSCSSAGLLASLPDLKQSARVRRTTDQSIPNDVETALAFDSEVYDDLGMHDIAVNTTRLTSVRKGLYLISANARFLSHATGMRVLWIKKNHGVAGTAYLAEARQPGVTTTGAPRVQLSVMCAARLDLNDFVEARVRQNSGGALDVRQDANATPLLAACWLGDY